MENFRTPNFELVAEILHWLVQRYDPSIVVDADITGEQERVTFLKGIATAMASKARIRLHTARLYGADGYAVKELLKIATVLHQAMKRALDTDENVAVNIPGLQAKLHEVKRARQLSSEITASGAGLYDSLAAELESREIRQRALAKNLDMDNIEKAVQDSISGIQDEVEQMNSRLQQLSADESSLTARIEKKKAEYDRADKRLKSLQSVRPAFMDEYEKLEQELAKLYSTYLERFRNLDYLERELDAHNQREQEKIEERDRLLQQLQGKLQDEERRILRGEAEVTGDDMFDDGGDMRRGKAGRARAIGTLAGGDDDDSGESVDDRGPSESDSGSISLDPDDSDGIIDDDGDESLQHHQQSGRQVIDADSDEMSDNEF
eukprot:TRINITY_DN2710_c0_g1_i1.p1 TRINITY_DN2710_c0_g1~~TRINITY_DN2710_c0_g1_i1.p1  ORF type:complete len:418 (+),score=102.14 TRINITY_DN2710_c0_g1_i1:122-1255(+)